jgi:hypothetical protein
MAYSLACSVAFSHIGQAFGVRGIDVLDHRE